MSTIDKFGRKLNDGMAPSLIVRQAQNVLSLDVDKNYTANNKRIKLVTGPEDKDDAVPRWYVDRLSIPRTENSYVFGSKRLSDVGVPLDPMDAATKLWVEGKCTKLKEDLTEAINSLTHGSFETLTNDITTIQNDIKGLKEQLSAFISKQVTVSTPTVTKPLVVTKPVVTKPGPKKQRR